MAAEEYEGDCGFDSLLTRNVPAILEKIFFSMDYESFKACTEVSNAWRGILTSESFRKRAKSEYCHGIKADEHRLCEASKEGDLDEIVTVLSSGLVDVNCVCGHYNSTPLCKAAKGGHREAVQLLLERGADPDKEGRDGQTPLIWAAVKCQREVAVVLLDRGADPNKAGRDGLTPLYWATRWRPTDLGELLLARGAVPKKV